MSSGRPKRSCQPKSISRQMQEDEELARQLYEEEGYELPVKPAAPKTDKPPVARRIPAMGTSTFGSKSPVADLDLQKLKQFLTKCMSKEQWEKYTDSEKISIIEKLPKQRFVQYQQAEPMDSKAEVCAAGEGVAIDFSVSKPPISPEFCNADAYLNAAMARFQRDLRDGYYEKAWQTRATKAHGERMTGEFDIFVRYYEENMFDDDDGKGEEEGRTNDQANGLESVSEDEEYSPEHATSRAKMKSSKYY